MVGGDRISPRSAVIGLRFFRTGPVGSGSRGEFQNFQPGFRALSQWTPDACRAQKAMATSPQRMARSRAAAVSFADFTRPTTK